MDRRALTPPLALAASLTALALAAGPAAARETPAGRLPAAELARRIDAAVDERLRAEGVQPSPRADDAEFLRRVYLDLTGRIPTAEKAAAFLDDRDPGKRAKLIDELLASPDYGRHQADIWQALLLPRTSDNRRVQFPPMAAWLEEQFNRNRPWDALVRDLVTASGKQDENGAVTYFLANPTVDKITDSVTKLFLGVQLQCAQCHNHPFTSWKQTEYWGMAAFFLKVRPDIPRPPMQLNGASAGVTEVANLPRGKRFGLPESAKIVPPKFLGGGQPAVETGEPLRPVLAAWLVSPENPYFSRAMVNRTWAQLFGRGIVHPVDDMSDANPPSHPQLLTDLAEQFAAGGFDVKYLTRAICNSKAYQRTSRPSGSNAEAASELLARMPVKVLTPEQLFDSLTRVLGGPNPNGPGGPPGKAKADAGGMVNKALASKFGFTPRTQFVLFFRGDGGEPDPTEYQAGIPQALRLMNAPQLNNAAAFSPLVRAGRPPAQVAEQLYLATLSRRPTPRERDRVAAYVARQAGEPRQAYADVLWALLNSSEFATNH
jgi:hypothetical protein